MFGHNNNKDVIFISKDLPKFNEGNQLVIHHFKNKSQPQRTLSFIIHDNDELFLLINRNTFGCAFFGNLVLPRPQFVVAVKYDPVLMLMNIFSNAINIDNTIEGKFVQKEMLVTVYQEECNERDVMFVQKVLMMYGEKLKVICEVKSIDDSIVMYKLLKSKCFLYLNDKIKKEDGMEYGIDKDGNNISDDKALIVCETIERNLRKEFINTNEYLKRLFKENESDDDNAGYVAKINKKNDNTGQTVSRVNKDVKKTGDKKKAKKHVDVSKNQSLMDAFVKLNK